MYDINFGLQAQAIVDDPERLNRCVNNIRLLGESIGHLTDDADSFFVTLDSLSRIVSEDWVEAARYDSLLYTANVIRSFESASSLDDPEPLMKHPWVVAILEKRPDFKKELRKIAKKYWAKACEAHARMEIQSRLVRLNNILLSRDDYDD